MEAQIQGGVAQPNLLSIQGGARLQPIQGGSVPAPSISYAGSPYTWYDYFTSVSLSVSNAGGSVTSYAVQSGTLPTGVSLNTSTGAITGTPTALKTAANVTIRATGPGGTSDAVLNIAVAWFPSSIAGLVAGYDTELGFSSLTTATDGSGGEAADTEAVGYMSDLSGAGNHVTQASGGSEPTVSATGFNSKRCIAFSGGQWIYRATFAGGTETQPNTVVVVCSTGIGSGTLIDGGDAGGRNAIEVPMGDKWGIYAGAAVDSGDNQDDQPHLHVALLSGASSKQWLDNTEIGSGNAGTDSMIGVTIGETAAGGAPLRSGSKVFAAAVYGADIGATARGNLRTWATAKGGTP